MMSLPDFKEKKILFVSAGKDETKVKINNENIALVKDGQIVNQLSCHKVFALFIIGDTSLTTPLIRKCRQLAVSLFLLKHNFEVYAKVIAEAEGNYLLREKQYALSEKEELAFAKNLIQNKLNNQLFLLTERKLITADQMKEKSEILEQNVNKAKSAKELLGIEGSQTKGYFSLYFGEYNWYRRLPRTKVDITNYLMDIGYTFLFNYFEALLALYGFDAYKGIYHKLFFQRKSLACDLIEPFRCLIDRQIVKSYNLKQINEKDFKMQKSRYFLPFDKQQKYIQMFFDCITDYKEESFKYVNQFYHCLMDEQREYPSFLIKK